MLSLNPSQTSLRPANLSGKIGIGTVLDGSSTVDMSDKSSGGDEMSVRSSGGVSIAVSVGVYTTSVEAGDEADGAQKMLYCSSSGIHSQYRSGFKTWPSSHSLAHWNANTLVHLS